MGKIFGISDLPVSTIMTPLEVIQAPTPIEQPIFPKVPQQADRFVSTLSSAKKKSCIDMKFGFGKLMQAFSKVGGKKIK